MKVEIEECKTKDGIDWGAPQLVVSHNDNTSVGYVCSGIILQTTGNDGSSENTFEAICLDAGTSANIRMQVLNKWGKECFKKFNGKITLQND